MTNNCSYTVWPAISSGAGSAALETMGFQLRPSQWKLVAVPYAWTGQVWGRTLCSTDSITGRFTCVTGDCGTGCEDCAGGGAAAPITLAQFQMNGVGGRDSYVVTVVDGFNIPMMVAPPPGAGGDDDCATTGCLADLNGACPPDLRVTSDTAGPVACMSACQAFGSPEYCCTGEHGDPSTCTPSVYSEAFKQACPLAITYPYDVVASSIFSCGGGGDTAITYAITFCPNTDRYSMRT